jgi:hypothetical protein
VPDGGYLYTDDTTNHDSLTMSFSFDKIDHLVKRIDMSASEGLDSYRKNEEALGNEAIMAMSKLTKRILESIDYEHVRRKRLENFSVLYTELSKYNRITFEPDPDDVPMVYPFLVDDDQLRRRLIEEKIYVATYWPDIINHISGQSFESTLVANLIPLPVDQRYGIGEMKHIVDFIKRNINLNFRR